MNKLLSLLCFVGVIVVLLFAPVLYVKWYEPMFPKHDDVFGAGYCFMLATVFVCIGLVIMGVSNLDNK